MEHSQQFIALGMAGWVAVLSLLVMTRRQRREAHAGESQFAASTEGFKRCPKCWMGNLWTDRNCISCGAKLPG